MPPRAPCHVRVRGRNLPRSPLSCFSDARARARLPRFRLVPAAEALMGLLFANLFWVGLWDLLDTTIFPFDSSYAMLLLVRAILRNVSHARSLCPHGRVRLRARVTSCLLRMWR